MNEYITPYTVIEVICFITAVICLNKDKEPGWRALILLLFITCFVEIGTIPMINMFNKHSIAVNSNAWVYNILLLLQMGVFTLMFDNILGRFISTRLVTIISVIVFTLLYLYELFYINKEGIFEYNSITNSFISVLFIIHCLYYYYLILREDTYINLKFSAEFWWVTGTLLFYYGNIVCNVFYNVLKQPQYNKAVHYSYIINTLILILYGCWIYSFICRKWLSKFE